MVKNKDRWSALSMSERADLIKLYVNNGITSLDAIKKDYNSFASGGPIEVDEYGYPADITPSIIKADYPRENEVWKRADASNADMVQRLKQGSSRATIQDWKDPRKVATHKMMSAGNYVVGNVQNINGQLFDFTDPKHGFEDPDRKAIDSAIERGDYIKFDTEGDARYFAEHYKKHYNSFGPGGTIETGKKTMLDPQKIVHNVPAREWGPYTLNENYELIEKDGTSMGRALFQYLGNKGKGADNIEFAKQIISDFEKKIKGNPNYNIVLDPNYESYVDAIHYLDHVEGLKKYLGLPYNTKTIVESNYKPTRLQGTDEKTYKFTSSMQPSYWDEVVDDMLIGEHSKRQYEDQTLNTFTAYRDRDNKGDFVSIYDEWDYNPAVRGGNKNLDKVIDIPTGGKPFVVYDRIYLDDHFNIPEEARGNPFITPAVVTAEAKGKGGKINRFNIGGPTREMTPSEAAALNKTLNNSQYMLAVGDSPDDPAYLSTDVLEPAVVKAFNSEEGYNRYQGEKFGEYVSNEISEAGTKLAPVLVGAAAAPWAISGGIAAYTNPITRSIIDLAGSIDGIRNAASKNGVRKTIRLAKEGDVWGTTKSAVGDIFDIVGGIGLAGDIYRYGKKASKSALLKNNDKIRDFAKGMSKNFKYALRSKQPIRFIWNNGNIIQNDFPKELLSEDAWYRIVGNGMRNKHFSDVFGAIADARNSGVVRTTGSKSIFKSPMFKKGIPFWDIQDNKALIVSNPGSDLDWVSVNYIGEVNPTVPLEKNNFVGTPLYKGEPNKAPSSMFTYWRKYPFIGWRNMPLHYEKGGFLNTFEEGGPKDGKHIEDVVRTTRGATGRIFTRDFPWVDVLGAKHLWDSWKVMRGNNKKVAPSDDNYTGTAMKGVGVQTDDGLGFVSQQDLANVLGYTPKDFVDTYVYGDTPFEELGVFKKETSPERHVVRSKVKKVEDSGKQVNTYQTQRDTLDTNTVAALDSLLNAGLVDLRSENTTYQKSPFNIGDSGIIYDGNNSTIATAYLPNGMPVSKAIDVFDTDPKEWNYKVGPLAKTGLSFIHDNTNPFLMTTPWYYPIKSTDFLSRLYYLFGIEADPEYNVISNKGDKNGVVWDLHEALEWLDSHPDLTEMPVKAKKD